MYRFLNISIYIYINCKYVCTYRYLDMFNYVNTFYICICVCIQSC